LAKKNYSNEKETNSSFNTPSVVRPVYTVVLISSIMILLLFSIVSFNFDILNIKEIDASPSYTTVSSDDYNDYQNQKHDQWRNDVNKSPFDNCVSGGSVNC
jgi:hypothetical protein